MHLQRGSMLERAMSMNLGRRQVLLLPGALASIGTTEAFVQASTPGAEGPVLEVGPSRRVRSLSEAARAAKPGTMVNVEAGEYRGDTAVWNQDGLALRAVGGRVRLVAAGRAAQGKALFVTRGRNISIHGFDFEGVQVPDRNGAGIRLEAGSLAVEDCRFLDSECGIITSNDASIRLEIRCCEFGYQRRANGQNHLLYAGTIARLSVVDSHFHHAQGGHLIKSRAQVHEILRNRLVDGPGGHASYELEFPNGGFAVVAGNIIEQASGSENPAMVSFGAEGYSMGAQALNLVHNTLVNRRPGNHPWIRVYPGRVTTKIINNLWAGTHTEHVLEAPGNADAQVNTAIPLDDFVDLERGDYRLRRQSSAWGRAKPLADPALRPEAVGPRLQPGALQDLRP